MRQYPCDVLVIGGGCAGMAAALSAREQGAEKVVILERSVALGGVLRQCIHDGFGMHRFGEGLTGPEYARRFSARVEESDIAVFTDTIVMELGADRRVLAMNREGLLDFRPGAVIIATGCRERSRGALLIPGSRPAGVMTAGTAQRYMNLEGYLVGKKVVILGSGDIGLIMARQFVLEGAEVLAVAELQPYSSGLTRNIVQCIEDFDIPLYFNTTVTGIQGRERLEGVYLSEVDEKRRPKKETERFIPCDSLILSVGLIPENELAVQTGMEMDPATGGAVVDDSLQTSIPGIFACGNALHVHDLVDFVTEESEAAGRNAALWLQGKAQEGDVLSVQAGDGVRGLVPQKLQSGSEGEITLQFRPADKYVNRSVAVYADGECIARKKHMVLTPGEMCSVRVQRALLKGLVKVQVEA